MINLKSNLVVKDKKSEIVKIPLKNLNNSVNVLDNYFIKKKIIKLFGLLTEFAIIILVN